MRVICITASLCLLWKSMDAINTAAGSWRGIHVITIAGGLQLPPGAAGEPPHGQGELGGFGAAGAVLPGAGDTRDTGGDGGRPCRGVGWVRGRKVHQVNNNGQEESEGLIGLVHLCEGSWKVFADKCVSWYHHPLGKYCWGCVGFTWLFSFLVFT